MLTQFWAHIDTLMDRRIKRNTKPILFYRGRHGRQQIQTPSTKYWVFVMQDAKISHIHAWESTIGKSESNLETEYRRERLCSLSETLAVLCPLCSHCSTARLKTSELVYNTGPVVWYCPYLWKYSLTQVKIHFHVVVQDIEHCAKLFISSDFASNQPDFLLIF